MTLEQQGVKENDSGLESNGDRRFDFCIFFAVFFLRREKRLYTKNMNRCDSKNFDPKICLQVVI